MDTNTIKGFLLLILSVGFVLLVGIGCDTILPEEFKEKVYETPEEDQYVCSLLSKPITTTANPRQVSDTTVVLLTGRTLASFASIPRKEFDTLTENQILKKYYAQIVDSLPTLPQNALIFFEYAKKASEAPKTIYAKIDVPAQATYTIYVSLEYYFTSSTSNLGENVIPEFLRSDTSLVKVNDAIPSERLSACAQVISGAGTSARVLTIKGRYEVPLNQGTTVVRFTLSKPEEIVNPTTKGLFYFKLYIR